MIALPVPIKQARVCCSLLSGMHICYILSTRSRENRKKKGLLTPIGCKRVGISCRRATGEELVWNSHSNSITSCSGSVRALLPRHAVLSARAFPRASKQSPDYEGRKPEIAHLAPWPMAIARRLSGGTRAPLVGGASTWACAGRRVTVGVC